MLLVLILSLVRNTEWQGCDGLNSLLISFFLSFRNCLFPLLIDEIDPGTEGRREKALDTFIQGIRVMLTIIFQMVTDVFTSALSWNICGMTISLITAAVLSVVGRFGNLVKPSGQS